MSNKTAITQAIEKLKERLYTVRNKATKSEHNVITETVLEVAIFDLEDLLETERQQIIEAYNVLGLNGEQYYNDKYGK